MSFKVSSFIALLGQIVVVVVVLLITPRLLNLTGKENWFHFATGLSIIFLSNTFSFGLAPKIVRSLGTGISAKKVFADNAGLTILIITVASALILFYHSNVVVNFEKEVKLFYLCIYISFLVNFISVFIRSFLEAEKDWIWLTMIKSLYSVCLFVLPFLFESKNIFNIGKILLVLTLFNAFLYAYRMRFLYKLEISINFKNLGIQELAPLGLFTIINSIYLYAFRLYYPTVSTSGFEIAAEIVLLEDLFGRQSMVFGTLSLVLYSYMVKATFHPKYILEKLSLLLAILLVLVTVMSLFFLTPILSWWLEGNLSINTLEFSQILLPGYSLTTFSIILVRILQAKGFLWTPVMIVGLTSIMYVLVVAFTLQQGLDLNIIAYTVVLKGVIDVLILFKEARNIEYT